MTGKGRPQAAAPRLPSLGKYAIFADGTDHIPMLVDLDPKAGLGRSRLLPTVFALWRAPDLLPQLLVPAHVSRFIIKGADLMWPGVYTPVPKMAAGALVAVRVVGNPAPIAVGTLAVSTDEAAEAGFRGVAVNVLHSYCDALWETFCKRVVLPNGQPCRASPPPRRTAAPIAIVRLPRRAVPRVARHVVVLHQHAAARALALQAVRPRLTLR